MRAFSMCTRCQRALAQTAGLCMRCRRTPSPRARVTRRKAKRS